MGDIFMACKRGDLERVQLLVEEMLCDVNVSDKWNATPLYYACLSGYDDIVHYILQSGADTCEFSGGRCMNCALTERTRHLLRNPPKQRSADGSKHFRDVMMFMIKAAYDNYCDVCLVIGPENRRLYAHKLVLCRLSPYFSHALLKGSNRGRYFIPFKHVKESSVEAWLEILNYMYTQTVDIGDNPLIFNDCLHLSRRLGLKKLTSRLREIAPKLAKKSSKDLVIQTECELYEDIAEIAISDLHGEGRKERQHFADLCIIVEEKKFYCHKAFIVSQSPYFAALLDTERFSEVTTSTRGRLTFITLCNITAVTFALIVKFIYSGKTEVNPNTLQDLLFYSDHYMIHGLKLACGELLASQLDLKNAVQTLSLARLLRMTKLQHVSLRFIAYNFEQIEGKSDLALLLVTDELEHRGDRLVRISESSIDSIEQEYEQELPEPDDDSWVDIQLDLRLYFRENTNKHRQSGQQLEGLERGRGEELCKMLGTDFTRTTMA